MKARVYITLKDGVLDPQGAAVKHALGTLGFEGVSGVRQGKMLEIDLDTTDSVAAKKQAEAMCDKLLANVVIENYTVEILQ